MSALAEFLRVRRERLSPAEVGLADSGRRRTPGLRREEVATLAGVSIDYLVRLEQGRDTNPSPSVLRALADALLLTESERQHLGMLAARDRSPELCPTVTAPEPSVPATVRSLLDRLGTTPAFVVGPLSDLLAWNRSWERLVTPLGLLDPGTHNLVRFLFLHPRSHEVYPDWARVADEEVSRLRAASMRWGADGALAALVAELQDVPEFTLRWATHDIVDHQRGDLRVVHPDAGRIHFSYEVLRLPGDGDQRLVTWLPADAATQAAIEEPGGRLEPTSPARLRLVGEA